MVLPEKGLLTATMRCKSSFALEHLHRYTGPAQSSWSITTAQEIGNVAAPTKSSVHKCQETEDGVYLEAPEDTADRRTQAEKQYDETMVKREADRVRKHADKSHRQRVAEFNTYLSKLTEHHDIPKVGPG